MFFKGAGVPDRLMLEPYNTWKHDSKNINKYEIARSVLTKLNEKGEACLRERREVLKRIVEFESFSTCWPSDQLKAKGLVAEIRGVVNVKDSFTRMSKERNEERKKMVKQRELESQRADQKRELIDQIRHDLFNLFPEKNHQKRGKALEAVLNSLFNAYGILIKDSFTLVGECGAGVVEQIDGVIELKNHIYFVEMKWWDKPVGKPEIAEHLVRVYHRAEGRAIIISASGYTNPAILTAKEGLQQKVIVLCDLQEIVRLLETYGELEELISQKVRGAIVDKNPYVTISN